MGAKFHRSAWAMSVDKGLSPNTSVYLWGQPRGHMLGKQRTGPIYVNRSFLLSKASNTDEQHSSSKAGVGSELLLLLLWLLQLERPKACIDMTAMDECGLR